MVYAVPWEIYSPVCSRFPAEAMFEVYGYSINISDELSSFHSPSSAICIWHMPYNFHKGKNNPHFPYVPRRQFHLGIIFTRTVTLWKNLARGSFNRILQSWCIQVKDQSLNIFLVFIIFSFYHRLFPLYHSFHPLLLCYEIKIKRENSWKMYHEKLS